jgi:hypothetical protein
MAIKICIQFAAAVVIGAIYECFDFVRTRASGLWLSAIGAIPKVPPDVARERLEACHNCPIFYEPTATCGSPFSKIRVRRRPAGCLCFMPFKVKFEGNCWVWEEMQENRLTDEQMHAWLYAGWKGALNSDA